jgi:hypothetical protein
MSRHIKKFEEIKKQVKEWWQNFESRFEKFKDDLDLISVSFMDDAKSMLEQLKKTLMQAWADFLRTADSVNKKISNEADILVLETLDLLNSNLKLVGGFGKKCCLGVAESNYSWINHSSGRFGGRLHIR